MKFWHCLIFLFISSIAAAQPYISRLGRFSVDEVKGCGPLTVTILDANLITVNQCTGPANACDMIWSDGNFDQNTFVHQYTQPGTYLLIVNYLNLIPRQDDILITVTANTPPTFDIFKCNGNQVQVKVTDTNYDAYIINYNDASAEVTVPKGASA